MARWLAAITPKAATPAPGGQLQSLDRALRANSGRVEDASVLRDFVDTMPLIFRAVTHRVNQVAGADWTIGVLDPDKPFDEKLQTTLTNLFSAPNPTSLNNSFAGLTSPSLRDLLTLDINGTIKHKTKSKGLTIVEGLECVDAGRLKINEDWSGQPQEPRYAILDQYNSTTGVEYLNDEMIVMSANPVSNRETGTSPVRVLWNTLQAYEDTMLRTWLLIKHGGPATLMNIEDAGDEALKTIRARLGNLSDPNSNLILSDFPMKDIAKFDIGSTNLLQLGVFEFYKWLVNEIACAFAISPMDLMQPNQVKYDSAETQDQITFDDGIKTLMRLYASFYTREIIGEYGVPSDVNLVFKWNALESDDEPEGAEAVRTRFGVGGSWMGIRAAQEADGQPPAEENKDPLIEAWLTEPRVAVLPGGIALPISIANEILKAEYPVAFGLPSQPEQPLMSGEVPANPNAPQPQQTADATRNPAPRQPNPALTPAKKALVSPEDAMAQDDAERMALFSARFEEALAGRA